MSTKELATAVPSLVESRQAEATNHPPESGLPEKPLVVIQPGKSWVALELREVWAYRELLYFLIWRDLKVRYKQTLLGASWAITQPLLMTVVFTIFLGHFARVPSPAIPYAVLAYTGLLPWTFFSTAVNTTGNSLVGSAHLITKVYFPRMFIPLAAVIARLVDFAVAFVIFGALMSYYHIGLTLQAVMLPGFVLLLTSLALALGMFTSALNVKYRDVGLILPVLLQIWMFASPIIYPIEIVPARWRNLYALNPLVGIINGFRASLLGTKVDLSAATISVVITSLLLLIATYYFRRMEDTFADIV